MEVFDKAIKSFGPCDLVARLVKNRTNISKVVDWTVWYLAGRALNKTTSIRW